jgi:enamine deaminase RidA (YjgF/YER057c/UK114 family)
MTIKRIHSGKRISRVVVHNGIAYLAGLQALKNRGGTVAEQTQDVLAMIDRLLAEAGTDKRHLLTATIPKAVRLLAPLLKASRRQLSTM